MRIVLVGAAASGKDFFRDFLYLKGEKVEVSQTTRPKRDGEEDGYTYDFISDEKFLVMKENDVFMEAVEFNGWRYGTTRLSWENNTVFIMTPSGIKHIPEQDREDCLIVFFDIPLDIRKERLMERSDADKADRRIEADKKDFEGFKDFDVRIVNPNFDPQLLLNALKEIIKDKK